MHIFSPLLSKYLLWWTKRIFQQIKLFIIWWSLGCKSSSHLCTLRWCLHIHTLHNRSTYSQYTAGNTKHTTLTLTHTSSDTLMHHTTGIYLLNIDCITTDSFIRKMHTYFSAQHLNTTVLTVTLDSPSFSHLAPAMLFVWILCTNPGTMHSIDQDYNLLKL